METGFALFLIVVALLIIVSGPTSIVRASHAIQACVQMLRRKRHDTEPDVKQQS